MDALRMIVRKELGLPQELYGMTQILRLHLFRKTPIRRVFFVPPEKTEDNRSGKGLSLFDEYEKTDPFGPSVAITI